MAAVEPVFWGIPPEKAYAATGGRMDLLSARQQGAVASIVIVTILGTQLVLGVLNPSRWSWPIVAYPMYKDAHLEGERLRDQLYLFAVFEDGTRIKISPEDLGLRVWPFINNVVDAIKFGRMQQLSWVIDYACQLRDGYPLTGLEVTDTGVAIARDGPVYDLEPEVYASAKVTC
jgi:hypothetical protein